VKLTTHLYLVLRLRMRGTIPPFPNTPSWRDARLKEKHRDNFTFYKIMIIWIRYQTSGIKLKTAKTKAQRFLKWRSALLEDIL
jgi:hypothetical protein